MDRIKQQQVPRRYRVLAQQLHAGATKLRIVASISRVIHLDDCRPRVRVENQLLLCCIRLAHEKYVSGVIDIGTSIEDPVVEAVERRRGQALCNGKSVRMTHKVDPTELWTS